ncbi:MAG: carboxypeptidase-like regulatory domain-containing protein, partial [Chloroflexota bacterium]|nr:carboxypeptidase-like regulatory domain-containing protein [Chloroflexota bacterium]
MNTLCSVWRSAVHTGLVRAALVLSALGLILFLNGLLSGGAAAQQAPQSPDRLGSIAGTVRDGTGAPVANIEISVLFEQSDGFNTYYNTVRTTQSDATGAYKAAALPTGAYYLRYRDPNHIYATEFYTDAVTVEEGADVVITGNDLAGVNALVAAGGRITGTVTIQNEVLVEAGNLTIYRAKADEWQIVASSPVTQTGQYDSGALPPGTYRVCVQGYTSFGYNGLIGCYGGGQLPAQAGDITIAASETKANLNIALGEGQFEGVIAGAVTGDGAPRAGIEVRLYNGGGYGFFEPFVYVLTDGAGRYRIGGLGAGQFYVGFS